MLSNRHLYSNRLNHQLQVNLSPWLRNLNLPLLLYSNSLIKLRMKLRKTSQMILLQLNTHHSNLNSSRPYNNQLKHPCSKRKLNNSNHLSPLSPNLHSCRSQLWSATRKTTWVGITTHQVSSSHRSIRAVVLWIPVLLNKISQNWCLSSSSSNKPSL
jgi:hypothetical protein